MSSENKYNSKLKIYKGGFSWCSRTQTVTHRLHPEFKCSSFFVDTFAPEGSWASHLNTPDTGLCTVQPISSAMQRSPPAARPPAPRTGSLPQDGCTATAAETKQHGLSHTETQRRLKQEVWSLVWFGKQVKTEHVSGDEMHQHCFCCWRRWSVRWRRNESQFLSQQLTHRVDYQLPLDQ